MLDHMNTADYFHYFGYAEAIRELDRLIRDGYYGTFVDEIAKVIRFWHVKDTPPGCKCLLDPFPTVARRP